MTHRTPEGDNLLTAIRNIIMGNQETEPGDHTEQEWREKLTYMKNGDVEYIDANFWHDELVNLVKVINEYETS